MRVLIDTNILLAIIPKKSTERWLYEKLRSNSIALILSNEILEEYQEKMSWFYSSYLSELVIEELLNLRLTEHIEAFYKWQLIQADPDDNKFVDIAIASNADYIITNDRHFNILQTIEFPRVNCITLQEFATLFK